MRLSESKRLQLNLVAVVLFFVNVYLAGKVTNAYGSTLLFVGYTIILPIDAFLNVGVSKVLCRAMRVRNSKRQESGANLLCKKYFLPHILTGIVISVLLLCTSELLISKLFHVRMSETILAIFSILVAVHCLYSWAVGGIRGAGGDVPVAWLNIGKQVLGGVLIFLIGRSRMQYGESVSAFYAQENFAPMHGGIGVAIAVVLAEGIVAVLAAVLCVLSTNSTGRSMSGRKQETMLSAVGFVTKNRIITMLCFFLSALLLPLGFAFFHKAFELSDSALTEFGVYGGLYLSFIGIFTAFFLHRLIPVAIKCTAMLKKDEVKFAKFVFRSGVNIGWVRGIFYVVFAFTMARMISNVFGEDQTVLLEPMIKYGTAVALFLSLALYNAEVLIQIGKEKLVLCVICLGDAVYLIALALLLNTEMAAGMALVWALLIASACANIVLAIATGSVMRIRFDFVQAIALPFVAAVLAAIASYLLGKWFAPHLGQALTLAICFVLTQFFFWIVTFVLRIFRLKELEHIPSGKVLVAIGQMFHLI